MEGQASEAVMGVAGRPASGSWPLALFRLLRVKHWLKNVFVLAPGLFSEKARHSATILDALGAFGVFCLISSALYIVNDLKDRREDAHHPRKRLRPLASGRIGATPAWLLALGLAASVVLVTGWLLNRQLFIPLAAYVANTLAYIFWLKYRVIIDVIVIACGFVIRLLAGCVAVSVEPSPWLLVCGFSLALVLGFGKRLAEVVALGAAIDTRSTLIAYTREKLVLVLAACTAVCLISYMLYTVAPDTVKRHETEKLVYTVPIVAYGLFRYLFKSLEAKGDGPTEILFADPVFVWTGLIWASAVYAILVWK